MTTEILLRYIHFVSIFTIVGTLASEYILLKKQMSRSELTRLARIDAVYGLAALTLLTAGLILWLGSVGKPSWYYTKNWIFYIKITLFAVIGLISIYPTMFFLGKRKGEQTEMIDIPPAVFFVLRMELFLLLIIPLLAGLMAHGVGYFGEK